jgi:hypothetical protein
MQPKWENAEPAVGTLVTRDIKDLRPHPSYARLHLSPNAIQISALLSRKRPSDPIVISHDRLVIDGHARLEIARKQGKEFVSCIEYALNEEEAIFWILARHQRLDGFNSFTRILLALELETYFQRKALLNQQRGGSEKGSLNLTEAERLDVRSEVATAAGVSTGNVSKVKHLLKAAHPEVVAALRNGEIRIHRAWGWSKRAPKKQLETLFLFRTEKATRKTVRQLLSKHRAPSSVHNIEAAKLACHLPALIAYSGRSLHVEVIKAPCTGTIFLSEDIMSELSKASRGDA